jgi:hypothetical protein
VESQKVLQTRAKPGHPGQGFVAAVGNPAVDQDTRLAILVLPPPKLDREFLPQKIANMINIASVFYEILKNI